MARFSPTRPIRKFVKRLQNNLSGNGIINYKDRGTINFIDVGSLGRLPEPWLSNAKHITNLLSFEPLEEPRKRKNVIISSHALWSENCRKPFYIYKGLRSTGSSLFEQNFEYVDQNFDALKNTGPKHLAETWHERSQLIRVTEYECKTLDLVLREFGLPFSFDFLKIDAQGAEYEILRGAENFLANPCIGLHLELFNIPLYKGIKLLPEVTEYLNEFGFSLVKKMPYHGTFNSQNDCIYIKREVSAEKKEKKDLILRIYSVNSSV
jgi:FkbM family methyltransferase